MTDSQPSTCDTSVLVPALAAWHPLHERARSAMIGAVRAVPAHVLLECYSVLTRLPAPHRVSAADAGRVIEALDLEPVVVPGRGQRDVLLSLARAGIRGGAVYDGLVAATATHHDLLLLTSDRRARTTYDVLATRYLLL